MDRYFRAGVGKPMAHDPGMALLLSGTGSLAHRKIIPEIFPFAKKHALLTITHEFSRIYCYENM